MSNGESNWSEWAKYVLKTLEELKAQGAERDKVLNKLVTEIKIIQTKMTMRAGLTGAIAGFLPAAAVAIYALIKLRNGT